MAKTVQELVGMESPFEAGLKAVGYKPPETKEQEKYFKEKAEADIKEAEGRTKIAEESAKRTEDIYAMPELQKTKIEAFSPTPETGSDLAKLFALTTAITFFGGGSGRYSGMSAMSNLASAMEGYKKGQKDLFAQELKEYDKNMKAAIENNKLVEDKLKEYLALSAKKDERALTKLAEVKALTARQGAAADIEKMTYEQLAKHAETIAKARADWTKHVMEMEEKGQARKDALLARGQIFTGSDGNTYSYDPLTKKVTPVELPQGVTLSKVGGAGGTKTSAATAGAVERMGVSMSQAADALDILSDMPITTTSPVYGQENFTGLFTAPLSVLNQQISETSAQMMRTNLAGVSRNLASLETGGAATGLVGLTDKIEKGIAIPAGSSTVVALNSLAEMRRIVESSARNALASPNYSESQKAVIRENLDFVRKAIPYTQKEINHAIRATQGEIKLKPGDENLSFTEFMKKYPLTKEEKIAEPIKQTPPKADKSVIDNERSRAKAAIAAGAPEDKVKERFKQKTGEDL